MRSRMSRYVLFESRWNLTDRDRHDRHRDEAHAASASTSITTSNASEIARSKPFDDELSNPNCTSSAIESTSDVMRETSTPAFLRSKNAERQRLHVVEHSNPQVAQEALADATDGHDLHASTR